MSELRKIFSESVPLLEGALRETEALKYSADLQLRGSVCGLATGALQLYMRERHNVMLDRRIASPPKAPRGLNSRRLQHVGLFTDTEMIDPSFGQFFTYVGLSPETSREQPSLSRLYPAEKIAVVRVGAARAFADDMAARMHKIEPIVAQERHPHHRAYPPENSLAGATLEEKRDVLRDIWNPQGYNTPFPLEDQSSSFQQRALRLAMRMHELERFRR